MTAANTCFETRHKPEEGLDTRPQHLARLCSLNSEDSERDSILKSICTTGKVASLTKQDASCRVCTAPHPSSPSIGNRSSCSLLLLVLFRSIDWYLDYSRPVFHLILSHCHFVPELGLSHRWTHSGPRRAAIRLRKKTASVEIFQGLLSHHVDQNSGT